MVSRSAVNAREPGLQLGLRGHTLCMTDRAQRDDESRHDERDKFRQLREDEREERSRVAERLEEEDLENEDE
jgi:hypothetical protein